MSFNFVQRRLLVKSNADSRQLLAALYQGARAFQEEFKLLCCRVRSGECDACAARTDCPAAELFSQLLSNDPAVVKRHQKPPLPLAFRFAAAADGVECYLTVAGGAVRHLPSIITAFRRSLKPHGALITGIWNIGYHGEMFDLDVSESDEGDLLLLSADEVMALSDSSADSPVLELLSPLRLVRNGSICSTFDLQLLVRSQMRRISAISAYYGDAALELDYGLLSSEVNRCVPLEEHFEYAAAAEGLDRKRFGGIIGCGEYRRVPAGVLQILELGACFNAGKGAAWGMGSYRVRIRP